MYKNVKPPDTSVFIPKRKNNPGHGLTSRDSLLNLVKDKSQQGLLAEKVVLKTKQSKGIEISFLGNKKTRSTIFRKKVGFLFLSLFSILLAGVVGWICIPQLLRQAVLMKAVISPSGNPPLYDVWVNPPIPIYFKVYVFNVTNAQDVFAGALPKLQEIGPYVFSENRTKIDIVHDNLEDTVSYKQYNIYHFEKDLSGNLSLEDKITILNVPFIAAAIKLSELPWPINDLGKAVLVRYKEPLYFEKTVGEILFEGWRVPFLDGMEEDLGITMLPNNTFNFLPMVNATPLGPITITRGSYGRTRFGSVIKYRNKTTLDFWGDVTSPCNQFRGTDGTIFPPFLSKTAPLEIFSPELCRSIHLSYNEDIQIENLKAYRFVAENGIFQDPRENAENHCFCDTIESNPEKCLKQGTLDIGSCTDGAPVALSTPYFLNADKEYIETSEMKPDPEKHGTFLDIEPISGVVLRGSRKIQINLMLKKLKGTKLLSKVPEILFPLIWIEECAELNKPFIKELKMILTQLWLVEVVSKWLLLGIAITTSVFCFRSMYMNTKKS